MSDLANVHAHRICEKVKFHVVLHPKHSFKPISDPK